MKYLNTFEDQITTIHHDFKRPRGLQQKAGKQYIKHVFVSFRILYLLLFSGKDKSKNINILPLSFLFSYSGRMRLRVTSHWPHWQNYIIFWFKNQCTGSPRYMRSFYLQICVYAIEKCPFFWNLSSYLQWSLVFLYVNSLYANTFLQSLSLAYNVVHLYSKNQNDYIFLLKY